MEKVYKVFILLEEFILRIKPYNDLEQEEAVTVEIDVKKDFFSSLYA